MALTINWSSQLVLITSPTITVDMQVLHDFIEDEMATPVGLLTAAIINPEGKIEDPSNPGVFSQIIIILNSPWQIQFWGGSGYTRLFGGKLVGGLSDEPMKATGTAGDITVLESPVDGLTVAGAGVNLTQAQADALTVANAIVENRVKYDPVTSIFIAYDTDGISILKQWDIKQADGTPSGTSGDYSERVPV